MTLIQFYEALKCHLSINPSLPPTNLLLTAGTPPLCCPAYTVKPGDTITSIATDKSVLPNLLIEYNSIPEGDLLMPGQIIQIPCDRLTQFIFQQLAAAPEAENTN